MFECEWLSVVQRERAKRGDGLNKLRTYAKFKSVLCLEPYLMHVKHEGKRCLLFKLRAGIAPLRIETGRSETWYDSTSRSNKKGISLHAIREENRTCLCCFGAVENEKHFVLMCPVYSHLRCKLLNKYRAYCISENVVYPSSDEILFNMIMGCIDIDIIYALANYVWDAFKIRTRILGN